LKYLAVNNQQFYFQTIEKPQILANQCLVKVHTIGVNRADILQKQGKYPAPKGESDIIGLEICGEVVAIGAQVKQTQIGDFVYGLVAGGGYAEYVAINMQHIMPLPKSLSTIQGAAVAETFLTAYQSLFSIGQLLPNQNVLIHAGASGVGSAAIQLASTIGCHVVTTVSNDIKGKACIDWGAEAFINYKQDDFSDWSLANRPQGYQVIVDVVAKDYIARNIKCAAVDGHIVLLAMLGGRYSEALDFAMMLMKRINIHASTLRNRSNDYKTSLIQKFIARFGHQLADGTIHPVIDSVYSWQDVEKAHQRMENNENIGKIVLTIE
jgi:putative PIG3 family NAD(P)H quinone oxidoreductase